MGGGLSSSFGGFGLRSAGCRLLCGVGCEGAVVDAFPEVDAKVGVVLLPSVGGLVVEVVVHGLGEDVLG